MESLEGELESLLNNAARDKLNESIPNASPSGKTVAIRKLIEISKNSLRISSDDLDAGFEENYSSFESYLSADSSRKIYFLLTKEKGSNFKLAYNLLESYGDQVEISYLDKERLKSKHVKAKLIYLIVSDDTAQRLEIVEKPLEYSRGATVNFGNKKAAKQVRNVFDMLREDCSLSTYLKLPLKSS